MKSIYLKSAFSVVVLITAFAVISSCSVGVYSRDDEYSLSGQVSDWAAAVGYYSLNDCSYSLSVTSAGTDNEPAYDIIISDSLNEPVYEFLQCFVSAGSVIHAELENGSEYIFTLVGESDERQITVTSVSNDGTHDADGTYYPVMG